MSFELVKEYPDMIAPAKERVQDNLTPERDIAKTLKAFVMLTKPTIMMLVVFSGAVAVFLEGSLLQEPMRFLMILLAIYLTGGAANALNQFFERDIDSKMERTRNRRPLPQGIITPTAALVFIITIALSGLLIFGIFFNWLSAGITLATIGFYSLFYTLWLKPNTPQNIVIGGAAGAMAPIGVWAAVTGEIGLEAILLFLIVFLWTPPHFWALALFCKEDYKKAGYPMMPLVKGESETIRLMFLYTILLVMATLILAVIHQGVIYGVTALALGVLFLTKTHRAKQEASNLAYHRKLFGFSIVYLFTLFVALITDCVLGTVLRFFS